MFCPQCGTQFATPDEWSDQLARCPGCGAMVRVPRPMFGAPPVEQPGTPHGPEASPVESGPQTSPGPALSDLLTPSEEKVYDELEALRNPKASWVQAFWLLVISLALFVALGHRGHPLFFTITLVGVILFHELGHYLGMRLFGYRNVRVFFIPLFGAAVSGQKTSGEGYQEAIVCLLGPLPGVYVSLALVGVLVLVPMPQMRHDSLKEAAILLGVLNVFNLLPIFPLDGGRFLNVVLFSRNRYLESVFQVLAAVALVLLGLAGGGWMLAALGVWIVLTVGTGFRVNGIAQQARARFGGQLRSSTDPVPPLIFAEVLRALRASMPSLKDAKTEARLFLQAWEKMHTRPPGAGATTALLLVYVGTLAALVVVPVVLLAVKQIMKG